MGREGWRIRLARPVLRRLVVKEAKRVLSSRAIVNRDGRSERWFKPETEQLLAAFDREANHLRPFVRLDELPGFGNQLMVEAAMFTLALDRALRHHEIDPSCSREILSDAGWSIYRRILSLTSLPARLVTRDPGRRLRWTIRMLLRFPFNARGAPGYAVQTWIEDGNIMTHFTHCPPQTFARRIADETDDPECLRAFRESWCRYDWPGADLIAGDGTRGHYRRTQALSKGDPVCDMCWMARTLKPVDG